MKRIVLLLVLAVHALLWGAQAQAAACISGSLGSFTALGAAGCSIGTLNFSDFKLLPSQTRAIPSTSIIVTPVLVGTTVVGIDFTVAPTASGGLFYDDPISYRVTGAGAAVTGATVDFTGAGTTGDAAVSVAQTLCLGGSFGPDGATGCSSGDVANLAVVDIFDFPDPAYSLAFAAVGSLGVLTDIAFDSGSGFDGPSSSTLTAAITRFNVVGVAAVPEPAAGLLLAAGLFGLVVTRRRVRRRHPLLLQP